jgi:hypothetical protein
VYRDKKVVGVFVVFRAPSVKTCHRQHNLCFRKLTWSSLSLTAVCHRARGVFDNCRPSLTGPRCLVAGRIKSGERSVVGQDPGPLSSTQNTARGVWLLSCLCCHIAEALPIQFSTARPGCARVERHVTCFHWSRPPSVPFGARPPE